MNDHEFEDLVIRSLDSKLSSEEMRLLENSLRESTARQEIATENQIVRKLLFARGESSFGPYFGSKVIHRIQNTGAAIDRQLFGLFRKFQLAAIGVVVALVILNIAFSDHINWRIVAGLDDTTAIQEEVTAPFDFSETLK